jgi:hypothetical protein
VTLDAPRLAAGVRHHERHRVLDLVVANMTELGDVLGCRATVAS